MILSDPFLSATANEACKSGFRVDRKLHTTLWSLQHALRYSLPFYFQRRVVVFSFGSRIDQIVSPVPDPRDTSIAFMDGTRCPNGREGNTARDKRRVGNGSFGVDHGLQDAKRGSLPPALTDPWTRSWRHGESYTHWSMFRLVSGKKGIDSIRPRRPKRMNRSVARKTDLTNASLESDTRRVIVPNWRLQTYGYRIGATCAGWNTTAIEPIVACARSMQEKDELNRNPEFSTCETLQWSRNSCRLCWILPAFDFCRRYEIPREGNRMSLIRHLGP